MNAKRSSHRQEDTTGTGGKYLCKCLTTPYYSMKMREFYQQSESKNGPQITKKMNSYGKMLKTIPRIQEDTIGREEVFVRTKLTGLHVIPIE